MDALAFLKKHGVEVCRKVAADAGSSYEYFSQLAYGHRRPSVDKANALVEASKKHVRKASEQLDFVSLVNPPTRRAAA